MAEEQLIQPVEQAVEAVRQVDGRAVAVLFVGIGIGFGIGFTSGYRFQRLKVEKKAEAQAEQETENIREFYREKARERAAQTPKPRVEDVLKDRGYLKADQTMPPRPTRPPVVVQEPPVSVADDTWDYVAELRKREGSDEPFVIHADEFRSNEPGHTQFTITYYEKDDILTDERDGTINDLDVVGLDNLQRFGHGSGNSHIVYVRNLELETDFEITRSPGAYSEEVKGLKHSDESGKIRRRARGFDDAA